MRNRISNILTYLSIFFLPIQTVWIFSFVTLPTGETQYGTLLLYGTEILIAFATLLRGFPQLGILAQKIIRPMFLLIAAGFLSLTFSIIYSVGLFSLIHLLSSCLLFLLIIDERTDVKKTILFFVCGLILPSFLGWFQYLSGWSPTFSWFGLAGKNAQTLGTAVIETTTGRSLRAYGSFPHPNIFGGYLVIGILFLGWLVRQCHCEGVRRSKQSFFIISTVILSSTLILTFSRSAWIALTTALVALLIIPFWKKRLVAHRAIPLISLGLFTILVTIIVFHSDFLARFSPELRVEAISLEERVGQYSTILPVVSLNPITGIGSGSYVFALARLFPNQHSYVYQPIHNVFLLIFAETGIVGIFAIGYGLFQLIAIIRKSSSFSGIVFAIAIMIAIVWIGLFDHYLWTFWSGKALLATCLAMIIRWQKSMS